MMARRALPVSVTATYLLLFAANVAVWGWSALALSAHPALWSLAMLAYIFGLRHAFDADHIAAIDNVVRKLLQQGKNASNVGLYFSLGHSTVVVLACAAIAVATAPLQQRLASVHKIGGTVGTAVSAIFLLLIGLANLLVLRRIWITFREVRHRHPGVGDVLNDPLQGGGFLVHLCQPLLRLVSRSWHVYPVGLLFGLGFDTATEVGLLSISAQSSAGGASVASVLIFPALFTAGMSLMDTTDSVLMVRAYGWAFIHPLRKLWYNLTMTAVSVIVALCIGGVEALSLLVGRLDLQGSFWRVIGGLNDDLSRMGYLVVAIFLASWVVSIAVYRLRGFEQGCERI